MDKHGEWKQIFVWPARACARQRAACRAFAAELFLRTPTSRLGRFMQELIYANEMHKVLYTVASGWCGQTEAIKLSDNPKLYFFNIRWQVLAIATHAVFAT
jgi:hypothetical protein